MWRCRRRSRALVAASYPAMLPGRRPTPAAVRRPCKISEADNGRKAIDMGDYPRDQARPGQQTCILGIRSEIRRVSQQGPKRIRRSPRSAISISNGLNCRLRDDFLSSFSRRLRSEQLANFQADQPAGACSMKTISGGTSRCSLP